MNKIHLEAESLPICCQFAILGLDDIIFLLIQKWVSIGHSCTKSVPTDFLLLAEIMPVNPWSLNWGHPKVTHSLVSSSSEAGLPNSKSRGISRLSRGIHVAYLLRIYKRTSPDPASESPLKVSDSIPLISIEGFRSRDYICLYGKVQETRKDSASLRSQKI